MRASPYRVGVDPDRPPGSDQILLDPVAGHPALTPEVAELAVAEPPGPFVGAGPDVAVGGEMKKADKLDGHAVAAVERLPPLFSVADVDAPRRGQPDLPQGIADDMVDPRERIDVMLAGLKNPRPNIERDIIAAPFLERNGPLSVRTQTSSLAALAAETLMPAGSMSVATKS